MGFLPGEKRGNERKNEGYRGLTKAVPVATMCCTLTPDLVGVSSGRGPNRAYPNLLLLIWTFSFLDGGVTKTQYVPSIMLLLYFGLVMRGHKTDLHIHTISLFIRGVLRQ